MLQTFWQFNRQNVRKLIDMAGGAITAYGAQYGQLGVFVAGVAVLALNYLWFWLDNRNKVTVEGLEQKSMSNAAVAVQDAMKAAGVK